MSTRKRRWDTDPTMWAPLLHAGMPSSFLRLPHLHRSTEELAARRLRSVIYGLQWGSTDKQLGNQLRTTWVRVPIVHAQVEYVGTNRKT